MKYLIFKGLHRAFPPPLWIYKNKTQFNWTVKFNRSAVYDIKELQGEINKLCGLGYFPLDKKDSARFGWRYNKQKDKIELLGYCHIDGKISVNQQELPIMLLDFDREYILHLHILENSYMFCCDDKIVAVPKTHKKKWAYKLGFFFGGVLPAPHTMSVYLKCNR